MKTNIICAAVVLLSCATPVLAENSGDLGETPQQAATRLQAYTLTTDGETALRAGNLKVAESDFRAAIAIENAEAEAYRGLAETLSAQGRIEEAIQAYRALIYPSQNWTSSLSGEIGVLMNYAVLLSQTGQWPEAVNIYEKALPRLGRGSLPRVDVHFDSGVPMPDQLQAAAHLVLGIDASNRLEHSKALEEYRSYAVERELHM